MAKSATNLTKNKSDLPQASQATKNKGHETATKNKSDKSVKGATKVIQKVIDSEKKNKKSIKKKIVSMKADMFHVNQKRQAPNPLSKGTMEVFNDLVLDMLDGFIETCEDLADHQHRDMVNERDAQAAVRFSFQKDLQPTLLNKGAYSVASYTE